jgi:hypothetical protein
MKKIIIIVGGISFLLLTVLFFKVVNADTTTSIPQLEQGKDSTTFHLDAYFPKEGSFDVYKQFPYAAYLHTANIKSVRAIKNDLVALDSLTNDPGTNRRTISHALTEVWGAEIDKQFKEYNPDSLLVLIQWAEQFQFYAQFDPRNDLFYQSVYTYWLGFVTTKLGLYSRQNGSLRHNFKYKYLVARCNEKKFSTSVKISDFEKAVDNLLYSNWGHLVNASWNQSGWFLKLALSVFFLVTLFGCYSLIKLILTFKKSKP